MNYRASLAALFSGRQKEDVTQSTATSYKNSINNADPCTFQIIWYLKHSTLKKK